MGKMQNEIKALRRQNTHLQNVVQRQRERLLDADEAIKAVSGMIDAHYAACAVQFGEKREDCGVLWGYHLEIPTELVARGLTDYTVKYELDKQRGVYVIGVMPKE